MKKLMAVMFAVLFMMLAVSCKSIFGPSDDEDSKPVTDRITYVRNQISCAECAGVVYLGFNKDGKEMAQISQITFETSITVYTEKLNEIYANDPKRYDGFDDNSYTHVAEELYVNGIRVYKSQSMGSAPWCGTVKYIHKNDNRIVQ